MARHRLTPASQPRQQVLELSQLNLGFALSALSVLSKDVENHGGAIDNFRIDNILEFTALARRKFGIGNHGIGTDLLNQKFEFLSLTLAEVSCHVRVSSALKQSVENLCAGSFGQSGKLAQGILGLG